MPVQRGCELAHDLRSILPARALPKNNTHYKSKEFNPQITAQTSRYLRCENSPPSDRKRGGVAFIRIVTRTPELVEPQPPADRSAKRNNEALCRERETQHTQSGRPGDRRQATVHGRGGLARERRCFDNGIEGSTGETKAEYLQARV